MATNKISKQNSYTKPPRNVPRGINQRCRPLIEDLTEYTENTTIHGLKYLGWKQRPLSEKIYWIIIFTICLASLKFFIYEICIKWNEKFVILVEDDTLTPIHKIPFPAVTICPHSKIKSSLFTYQKYVEKYLENNRNVSASSDEFKKFQVAQQVCHYKTTLIMGANIFDTRTFLTKSHVDLLFKLSPTFEDILNVDMISDCKTKLSNYAKNSTAAFPLTADLFSTVLTNEGVCFTLNLNPEIIRSENTQNDYLYYNYSRQNKRQNSCPANDITRLKINLASNRSDINLCQPTYVGYKIILHSPEKYPSTFENYIGINHESTTKIKVEPKMITTSQSLRRYTPKQRQCYFNDERQLKFFKFYNRINCKLECFANYTLQVYGCVHYAFPRSPAVPICGETLNYYEMYQMVDGLDSLFNYLQDNPDKNNDELNMKYAKVANSCDCLSECNSIEYDYTTIVEHFSFDKILDEIQGYWNATAPDSPAEIEIFWESSKFKGTIRKQLYSFTDLVSHFGGLLGLFMGASILSIFEIIYFCVVRQFTKKTQFRRVNSN